MRQKFIISRIDAKKQLRIREYAVVERDPKKVALSMLEKSKFSFLCEETYNREVILEAIDRGMQSLVPCLRTRNIFPITPYISGIAEAVVALYDASEDGSVELSFDDAALVARVDQDAA